MCLGLILPAKVSHLKNLSLFNFEALDPKFILALEPRVLELKISSFGIRPYIYVLKGCYKEPPQILAISVIVPALNCYSESSRNKGLSHTYCGHNL